MTADSTAGSSAGSSRKRILVTGANGQLGRSLQALPGYDWIPTDTPELDITDTAAIERCIVEKRPDAVVNAAAYTAVDKAEEESDLAFRVNGDGPRLLAVAAAKHDLPLVHISTDYVFDGTASQPYTEDDTPSPRSVYGESKLAGERGVREAGGDAVVVRVSWLFSEFGPCFPMTMRRLALEREELRVVADQYGAPTFAGDLALLVTRLLDPQSLRHDLYHYRGAPIATWHEFATRTVEACRQAGEPVVCNRVVPISTADFPTAAERPMYSVLDTTRIESETGIVMPEWSTGLDMSVAAYRGRS